MFKLMQAFERTMKRFKDRTDKPQHVVVKYNYSMEGQRAFLLDYMQTTQRVAFETLFAQCQNRIHAIFTFLSMLELIQQRFLAILIGTGRNNFIIERNDDREEDLNASEISPSDSEGPVNSGGASDGDNAMAQ
jgi:segregation and condensation protein A